MITLSRDRFAFAVVIINIVMTIVVIIRLIAAVLNRHQSQQTQQKQEDRRDFIYRTAFTSTWLKNLSKRRQLEMRGKA